MVDSRMEKEPVRWPKLSTSVRFWRKVDKSGDCWLWTASKSEGGYGQFSLGKHRSMRAHKWAWIERNGLVPDGLQLDHLCRVRHCVNPDHLEAVTPKENTRRSESPAALNSRKTHCPRNHAYDEANTYNVNGERHCRACNILAQHRYLARKRGEL